MEVVVLLVDGIAGSYTHCPILFTLTWKKLRILKMCLLSWFNTSDVSLKGQHTTSLTILFNSTKYQNSHK